MERVGVISAAETTEACVACQEPLLERRCGHCGAAASAGNYRIERVIAQGAHGRMYLAVDSAGRKVALKELLFSMVPSVQALDAFEREAQVLRGLDHPQIPRFVESFREGTGVGTRLYLAQQFLPAPSLLTRLQHRTLSEQEARALARSVLSILGDLHRRRPTLLHRDIKPANILLGEDGKVWLVDFGAARELQRGVTHGATLVGTFGYMPLEQLGGTVDASSDLYALGATLVHALTGIPPSEMMKEGGVLEWQTHVPALSSHFRHVLARLLSTERSGRFQSAGEVLAALDDTEVKAPLQAARDRSRSGPTIAAVAIGLAVALTFFLLVVRASPAEAPSPPQFTTPVVPLVPVTPKPPTPAVDQFPSWAYGLNRELQPKLRRCAEGLPAEAVKLSGKVTLRFTIHPSGRIDGVKLSEAAVPRAFETCVVGELAKMNTKMRPSEPTTLQIPLLFPSF